MKILHECLNAQSRTCACSGEVWGHVLGLNICFLWFGGEPQVDIGCSREFRGNPSQVVTFPGQSGVSGTDLPKMVVELPKKEIFQSCSQDPDKPISALGFAVGALVMQKSWKLQVQDSRKSTKISVTCPRLGLLSWFKMFYAQTE